MRNNRLIIGLDDYIFEDENGCNNSRRIFAHLHEVCENYLEVTNRGDFLLHLDDGIEDLQDDYKTIMDYIKPYYRYAKAV